MGSGIKSYRVKPSKSVKTLLLTTILVNAGLGLAARAEEAPKALSFDAVLTTDWQSNIHGGLKTGQYLTKNLDFTISYQGENGWEAFGYMIMDEGGGLSANLIGDTQGVTNIDAPEGIHLMEAWVKKTNAAQTVSFQFGAINANSIFDVNDNGAVFVHASQGMGPDLAQSLPSAFPLTSIGAITEFTFSDTQRLSVGVFDAVPGDPNDENAFAAFNYSEEEGLKWLVQYQQSVRNFDFTVGYWQNPQKAERIDGTGKARNNGAYGLVQTMLTREDGQTDQGLKGFARIGYANSEVHPIASYVGAGLSYQGLIEGRDDDVAGIAFAKVTFGKAYQSFMAQTLSSETAFEITYQAQIVPGMIIQPNVQYVKHPSGDHAIKDALVVGIRFRIGLETLGQDAF